jgi:hypothetical protein
VTSIVTPETSDGASGGHVNDFSVDQLDMTGVA